MKPPPVIHNAARRFGTTSLAIGVLVVLATMAFVTDLLPFPAEHKQEWFMRFLVLTQEAALVGCILGGIGMRRNRGDTCSAIGFGLNLVVLLFMIPMDFVMYIWSRGGPHIG